MKLKTAWGEEITVGQFVKYMSILTGLLTLGSIYLFACVWLGSEYSYTGGWFMFLTAFFMPIRFIEKSNEVMQTSELRAK